MTRLFITLPFKINPRIKILIRLTISFLLFFLLFRKVDFFKSLENLKHASPIFLIVFVFFLLNYLASSLRWRELLIYTDKSKVRLIYLLKLYYIGSFLSSFMPSTIGGDVYKAYKLGVDTKNMAGAVAATFMERLIGLVSLSLISSVSLVFLLGIRGLVVFVIFWILIILGFLGLSFFSRFIKPFKKFYEAVKLYRNHKKSLVGAFLYSLPVQVGSVFSHFFTSYALGINISVVVAFFIFPLIGFLSFLPISFAGIGIQDNTYVFAFERLGISASLAASASIFYHFLKAVNGIIGWTILTFDKEFKGSLTHV